MSDLDQLATALAEVHKRIKNPVRNMEWVRREGAHDEEVLAYASLDYILEENRPLLAEYGLSVIQAPIVLEGRGVGLATVLLHSAGQSLRFECPLVTDAGRGSQAMGAAITYLRRQALTALLNISAEEDDDGNTADDTKTKVEANPTAKQTFGGPLTKTQLKAAMRMLAGDLASCEDISALDGLLGDKSTIQLLAQCKRDLIDWYDGKGDSPGVLFSIAAKRKELSNG